MVTQSLLQADMENNIPDLRKKIAMEGGLVNLLRTTSILSMVKISVLTPK